MGLITVIWRSMVPIWRASCIIEQPHAIPSVNLRVPRGFEDRMIQSYPLIRREPLQLLMEILNGVWICEAQSRLYPHNVLW